jgi:hypothetical protein
MAKFCTKCGAPLAEEGKFCTSCGASIEKSSTPAEPNHPAPSQPTNMTPIPPKPKSNMKIIGAVIAVVIAVVIILAVVFLFLDINLGGSNGDNNGSSGGSADTRFVGTWDYSSGGITGSYIFKSDGTLAISMSGVELGDVGTWSVNGNQLCIEFNSQWSELAGGEDLNQCITYQFSDGGNTLTLTESGSAPIVLTKTGSTSEEEDDEDGGSGDNGGGTGEDYSSELVGTWTIEDMPYQTWVFYSNGTLKWAYDYAGYDYNFWYTYNFENGQLCLTSIFAGISVGDPVCGDFVMDAGGDSFTYTWYDTPTTFNRVT